MYYSARTKGRRLEVVVSVRWTFWDRLAEKLRPALVVGAIFCGPAALLFLVYGLIAVYKDFGIWAMAVCVIAVAVVALGLAGLIDSRQAQNQRQRGDQ